MSCQTSSPSRALLILLYTVSAFGPRHSFKLHVPLLVWVIHHKVRCHVWVTGLKSDTCEVVLCLLHNREHKPLARRLNALQQSRVSGADMGTNSTLPELGCEEFQHASLDTQGWDPGNPAIGQGGAYFIWVWVWIKAQGVADCQQ